MIGLFVQGSMLRKTLLTTLLLLGAVAGSRADDSVPADLQRCASVADETERLACYDELAGRVPPAAAVSVGAEPPAEMPPVAKAPDPAVPAAAPAPQAAAAKTLEDIDSETSPKAVAKQQDELLVRARVTRCEKDARNKYYFVFDNGQVWKQVSDKRLRYRECAFEVTITKDFFGYKMQPDGEKGRIRIDRVK